MSSIPGEQSPTQPQTRTLSNMTVRAVTALVLLPVVLFVALLGSWPFAILVGLVLVLGMLEFYILAKGRASQGSSLVGIPTGIIVAIAFYLQNSMLWFAALLICLVVTFIVEYVRHPADLRRTIWQTATTLGGVLYIAFPASFLIAIRALPHGEQWLFVVFAITWGTDTMAYLGGRWFGRHKLAPRLSPKKTIEGAVIGVLAGMVVPILILLQAQLFTLTAFIMIAVAPFVAIAGDLFESALKRFFDVKDSHVQGLNVFPGHGGVLDRVDSLICVAAWCFGYIQLTGIAL